MHALCPRRLYTRLKLFTYQWLDPNRVLRPVSLCITQGPNVTAVFSFRSSLSKLENAVIDHLLDLVDYNWMYLLYTVTFGNLADLEPDLEGRYCEKYPQCYKARAEYFGLSLVTTDRSLWYLALLTDYLDVNRVYYQAFVDRLHHKYRAVALGLFFKRTLPPVPLTMEFARPLSVILKALQPRNRCFIRWGLLHVTPQALQERLPPEWQDCIYLSPLPDLTVRVRLTQLTQAECQECTRVLRQTLKNWWIHASDTGSELDTYAQTSTNNTNTYTL